MSFAIWFIVLSLATWRVTSLLVNEAGPFDLFAKLRHLVGVRYDERSVPYGTNVLANAFSCIWCMSVWIALIAAIFLFEYIIWWQYPIVVLALSAAAIMIEKVIGG